jgi:hypothetical protein
MKILTALAVLTAASFHIAGFAGAAPMLDPSTDRPGEEWCYLAKSTTVIGVPFQPDVTQLTFDGAVFTRNAELCFFYGTNDTPLLARGKTLLDGWLPLVQYAWRDGDLSYEIEYFAAPLTGEGSENTVNFARLRMRNGGTAPATGSFVAALRHNGGDYRSGGTAFSAGWRYEMTDATANRDGKLVYAFSPCAVREAVPGMAYGGAFAGFEHALTARSECCLARYTREMKPGEAFAATFKMPRVPAGDPAFSTKVTSADYESYRSEIIAYWQRLFRNTPVIELPEKRFQNAYRASLVHLALATRSNASGRRWQTDGLPYPDFFLTSVPEMAMMYLVSGLPEFCTGLLVPGAIVQQQESGLYFDRAVAHGKIIPATQGHILYSIAQTVLFTQDKAFAEKIYPSLQKGVGFIEHSIKTDKNGLLPRCHPYDAEMIDGHYTGQNLFALMGLRYATRVARFLGKADDATAWSALAAQYETNILKAIAASVKADGYVPTGLYAYGPQGVEGDPGSRNYYYDADWENVILAWPTEMLAPDDPRVRGTLTHVRRDYAEGIMTYRHGQFLHQYITSNMIEQYLAMGDGFTALKDFYHQLLHSGSTHESFENLVRPWTDRMVDPGCPPPHAWGTSKQGLTVRNFLLMEHGGKCGEEAGRRELWVFHCLSPAWVKPGEHVSISNAPTEFGTISARMDFRETGADLKLSAIFHEAPAAIRFRIPYFKELISVASDAKASRDGDCILLSPGATSLKLEWRDKAGANLHTVENILTDYRAANRRPGARVEPGKPFLLDSEKSETPHPLSFDLVRETFRHEYSRLAEQSVAEAGQRVTVAAPAMHRRGPVLPTAAGWRAAASAALPDHGPELAGDGETILASSWQADPYPQWWQADLGKVTSINRIHVFPYWGMNRYYKYTVEVSTDGKGWSRVADLSGNTTPSTPAGNDFRFQPVDARYVRVTMLYHSLNSGVHLVELRIFPPQNR